MRIGFVEEQCLLKSVCNAGLDLTGGGVKGVEAPSSQCQPTQLIENFDPGGSDYSGF